MRRFVFSLFFAGLFSAVLPAYADTCSQDALFLRGPWGQARFGVEIADTPAEQARGLMFRESLGASKGMLFVYDRPGAPAFWMKNTLIPLDMLFITPEGVVQYVHANAIPGDLTPISGGPGVQYVLEIKGGMAARLGIAPGSELHHPAIAADLARWPCEAPADDARAEREAPAE
ncbi:MAG TPA: DUF192 domain-containing protein [Aliiroseovarius sp.]|nr:DUF192 domain-containing protein [Aliiroseovarius sp.]